MISRFTILVFLLLVFSSCDQPLKEVEVGITPFFGEAAFYVAEAEGFFEEQGLDVVPHPRSAGKKSLSKLYASEIDIAHTAELPMVYAMNGSPEYKGEITPAICANMIYNNNIQKVVARRDQGIDSPSDLVNKRIGYFKGTTSEFFLDNFLLEHNIPDTAVEKVNIDVAEHLDVVRNGKVDAVVSWEPYASKILSEMEQSTVKLSTQIDHSTLWLMVASEEYVSENPGVIEAYLRALKKAHGWISNHPDQTQRLLASKTSASEEVIENLWPSIDYELSLRERLLLLLEDQERWLRQKGYVEHGQNRKMTDYEKLIYFNAMEQVHPQGITIIR